MAYQKSQYNMFVPYNDSKTIIFNTFSGAIGLFDVGTLEKYNNDTFSYEEIQILLKKGILIPIGTNEKSVIDQDRKNGILYRKEKLIRVWTTSACNAQCYYCFEKGLAPVHMTEETANQVILFISSLLNPGDILTFEWFGGEPFLNTNIIDYIIDKIRPICLQMDCKLQSTFISNGSIIDESIIDRMKTKWQVKSIQITLDGDEEVYNAAKNYSSPEKHNFFNVINNIKLLAKNNIHIAIRMNYDTTNFESLLNLIDYLHNVLGEYKNIFYYVYPLWSSLNENADNPFVSKTVADKKLLLLFDKIAQYNMTSIRMLARLNYKKNQCSSCSVKSFTIFPDGKIGKCSETFMQTIGDVWNGITDVETFNYWTDIGLSKECETCVYLPLCQGGCRSSYFTKMPKCFAYKDILPDILKWYVSKLQTRL